MGLIMSFSLMFIRTSSGSSHTLGTSRGKSSRKHDLNCSSFRQRTTSVARHSIFVHMAAMGQGGCFVVDLFNVLRVCGKRLATSAMCNFFNSGPKMGGGLMTV